MESETRTGKLNARSFAAIAITAELLLIPAAWLLAWLWPGAPAPHAEWVASDAGLGVLLTLPLVAFLALITWTPLRDTAPVQHVRRIFREVFGDAFAGLQLWQIVALSVAAGVGEELLFRGTLQPRVTLVPASLLFGAVHWITPTYFVFAASMGLYLGWVYADTQRLLIPMVIHAVYDAVALTVIRSELRREGFPRQKSGEENQ